MVIDDDHEPDSYPRDYALYASYASAAAEKVRREAVRKPHATEDTLIVLWEVLQ